MKPTKEFLGQAVRHRALAMMTAMAVICVNCFIVPAVQAQTTPVVANSVFNVFSGGKITLGDTVNTQAFCNPGFYDSPQLNVTAANLLGTKLCKNTSSTATAAPATTIAASGANVSRLTLPTYLSTVNPLDVNFANGAQVIINNGSSTTQINGDGQQIVTSSNGGSNPAQTLTLKKLGSTLTLPAGEYAKVNLQVNSILHFQAGVVPTRIKQLNVSNCNGSTMEFEPGDYYIENANWQQSCHLTVSPAASGNTATSVNLYFKNAFTLNAGPTCWNMSSGTCNVTTGASQIQAQQPEKLKLYLYSGNFTTYQGARIAAGIYVDQGDLVFSSAGSSALIGEAWAKNISTTNGGPTAYAYKPVLSSVNNGGGGTVTTPPTVSLSSPVPSDNFNAPANITLTASAVAASGNSISKVQFYQGSTLIGTATAPTSTNGSNYSISWTNVAASSYIITVKATDNKNNTSTSTPVTINVIGNKPPTVSMTANPAKAKAPATILFTSLAEDSDGSVSYVEYYNGDTLLGANFRRPYSYNWEEVPAGTYTVTAKAYDNMGASTVSAPVTVTVVSNVAKLYDIHSDQLGTPRVITDSSGTEVWRWDSTPFGETPANEQPTSGSDKFTFNIRFPGQYFDSETNLHYNYFRDYDPNLGRYMQSDPIGLAGGLNTYLYVEGNPASYSDSSGLVINLVQQGNNITITIPITYVGSAATPEVVKAFNKAIQDTWTGSFGPYNVVTNVVDGPVGDKRNVITIVNGGKESYVNGIGGATGVWSTNAWQGGPATAAHEVGHLMDLDNRYYSDGTAFNDSKRGDWRGNIMADAKGRPDARNIRTIIDRYRWRWQGGKFCEP